VVLIRLLTVLIFTPGGLVPRVLMLVSEILPLGAVKLDHKNVVGDATKFYFVVGFSFLFLYLGYVGGGYKTLFWRRY